MLEYWETLTNLKILDWINPFIDVLIVAFLIYSTYKLIDRTRGVIVLRGIVILAISYGLGFFLELNTFIWIFEKFLEVTPIALVILFQNELRRLIMKLGTNRFFAKRDPIPSKTIEILPNVVKYLAKKRRGALIVIVRKTGIRGIVEKGKQLDALLSEELIEGIFEPTNPLHDGALIIEKDRIAAASCYLPLSENIEYSQNLGTRHRSALGLSEETDAIILVVSEENGGISLVTQGKIDYNIPSIEFQNRLENLLLDNQPSNKKNGRFGFKKIFSRN